MQTAAASSPVSLLCEIGGLDDERVAFPVAARVSQPSANVLREVGTPIEGDDPNAVIRDHVQKTVSWNPQDLRLGVVVERKPWRFLVPRDATRVQVSVVLYAGACCPHCGGGI